jgi:hypothetical protein
MELVIDNASVPERVQWRGRESIRLPPMSPRLGRNLLARTLVEAWQEGVQLGRMAALAWQPGAAVALSNAAGAALAVRQGYAPDELQLEDFDSDVIVGTLGNVAHEHSDERREPILRSELDEMADEYLAMVRAANDLGDSAADTKFLRQTRKRIEAAVSLIVRAPLFERTLWEEWALVKAPDFSMVAALADQYAEFKHAYDVVDVADIMTTPVRPVQHCELALIDQAGIIPPLGFKTLRRLLPRATFVFNG